MKTIATIVRILSELKGLLLLHVKHNLLKPSFIGLLRVVQRWCASLCRKNIHASGHGELRRGSFDVHEVGDSGQVTHATTATVSAHDIL